MANYIDGYYYTVAAYEAKGYENVPTTGTSLSNWIPINSTKKVNTDSKILYRVTIFDATAGLPGLTVRDDRNNTVVINPGPPAVTRIDGGSRLSGSGEFATFKNSVKDIADISNIRTIDDKYYDFTVTPKKDGTVSPKLVPQVEINGIWRDVKIQTGSKIPSVVFTKAATAPEVPATVKAYDAYGKNEPYQWDSCNSRWVRLWHTDVKEVPAPGQGGTTVQQYKVFIKYFDKNGNRKDSDKAINKKVNGVTVSLEKATEAHVPGSLTQLGLRELDAAKNCVKAGSGGTGNKDSAVTISGSVKSADTFNPPPHIMTRHFSPIAWGGTDSYDDGNAYNQLGMIYQDPDTVTNTAKVYGSTVQKFWGFRFLFNPTFWNYQISASNNVDWTRKNENNAVLITSGVGGTMSLRLVIDRVADMNTMRRWVMNGRRDTIGSPNYPKTLTPEQCEGILRRGTEYDLEYMFRVFNGNPEKSTLLGAKVGELEMDTANLGYVTSLPFVLKLNDQQRYKVILSSLTVQHDMFTHEMIPIRTLVDLGVERIPDFYSNTSKYLTIDTQTQLIQKLPSAATNSGSSSTSGRNGGGPRGAVID